MSSQPNSQPHIVILGAGFAGLHVARHYQGAAKVTLIDKQNHHLFQPLLYQVATAALSATEIASPIRSILKNKENVSVMMDEVTAIEHQEKYVKTRRARVDFDYLVIALGGQTSYFGHSEWEQYAPGLKTLADALRIRTRMLECFELAEMSSSADVKAKLMRTVIVGGGPTGVEMAGAMADLTRNIFSKDFREIQPEHSQIILIDGGERLLNPYRPSLSQSALEQLESLGVEVRLNTLVTNISDGKIRVQSKADQHEEIIEAGNIVWGGGIRALPLTEQLPFEKDKLGRLKVETDLSIPGHPSIFAIGDIASVMQENGDFVPGVAPAALQMGESVAKTLRQRIQHPQSKGEAFRYWDKGSLATIGRSKAVAQLGRINLTGFLAWLTWLFIHLLFLVGFRNRLATLIQWFYQYLSFKTGARIIPDSNLNLNSPYIDTSISSEPLSARKD